MTKYQHDCEKCHYLGAGKCPALCGGPSLRLRIIGI